jgi:hypothetical protein
MRSDDIMADSPLLAGTVAAINSEISALLNGDGDMAEVGEALARFGRRGLVDCLTAVAESEADLAVLASVSYLHGNGFFKIPLARCESHSLRLHIWRVGSSAEENLHSHRWPFASAVLLGELTCEIWEDGTGDDALIRPEMIYRGNASALEPIGDCRVRLKTICRYHAGDRYWLPADGLHRIVNVGSGLVATLMAHPRNTRSWARNILLHDLIPDPSPEYLSADALRSVLDDVVKMIPVFMPR